VAHAGPDVTLECAAAAGGTLATLDGTTSEGPDLSFEWTAPGVTFDDPHSVTPTGNFPLGVNEVVLTVSRDGNVDRDTVVVTVLDTKAPTLGLAFEPQMLWPPDHQLVHVHVVAAPVDACDSAPAITLLSVTSSEPDGGPGDPFPVDILDASYGQADVDVWLRAQREPGGEGRAYTLCYEVRDATGHTVEQCASVIVPQSLGRARLESANPPRLTVFGDAGMPVASVDAATIVVSTWNADLLRAAAASGIDADVDQDGFMDRTWWLEPVEGSPEWTATAGAPLYARWRAGGRGYYVALSSEGVTAVGGGTGELRIDLAANPARGQAMLVYELPGPGRVRLHIYDIAGRAVAKLVDGRVEAGRHEVTYAPRVGSSTLLFYRFEWEGQRRGGRFVLMK
jgi:hypothetical protein